MFPGPVFTHELVTTAHRARYYRARFVYGIILLFFIWRNDPRLWYGSYGSSPTGMSIQELADLGRTLFRTFLIVQWIAVLLLVPALVAGVIADEKQRKTLHYLLASRLSSGEIVLGKLGARMLHIVVFVAIGMPIMSLLSLFGGVEPMAIVLATVATLTSAFFVAALAILASVHARNPREAISLVYMLEAFWLFVPPLTPLVMPRGGAFWLRVYDWIGPLNSWIAATSPFSIVTNSLSGLGGMGGSSRILDAAFWMIGLQAAYGLGFVLLAILRLRPAFRHGGEGGPGNALLGRLKRRGRIFSRPECGEDAMMWKERFVSRTSITTKVVAAIVVLLSCIGLISITYDYARPAFEELVMYGYGGYGHSSVARIEFNRFLRFVCTALYVLWALGIASTASGTLASEREEDTWISLIATPMDASEIIPAKMFGAVWSLRWVGVLMISFWCLGLLAGSIHPFGFVAVILETVVYLWFAAALGTYTSLRSRTSGRALLITVTVLFVVNGAYLLCCLGSFHSMLVGVGVTPMIEAYSLISYEDMRSLLSGTLTTYNSPRYETETVVTCFMSILGYIIAAGALTQLALGRFDEEAGRPRREVRIAPSPPIGLDDGAVDEKVPPSDKS